MRNKKRKYCNLIGIAGKYINILFTILCFAYSSLFLVSTIPNIEVGIVKSGSMEPAIPTGSIVYIAKSSLDKIHVNDIIAYRMNDMIVIHRIIDFAEEGKGYITQGDNNKTKDISPVSFEQLNGKVVFHIPYLGYVHSWLQCYIKKILLGLLIWYIIGLLVKVIKIHNEL